MVVNAKKYVCERCGATRKEATLTRSHCPQQAVIMMSGPKRGWKKSELHEYVLCRTCHDVWGEVEKQILREACAVMRKRHEDYLNQ